MKRERLLYVNGRVVLPDRVAEADVAVQDGCIHAITERQSGEPDLAGIDHNYCAEIIDLQGAYLLPGLIDIHCDAIEKEVQPRPNTLFPRAMAFAEFERKLPLHGITTMYHSLSLGVGLSLRGDHLLTELVDHIRHIRAQRAFVRNRIHLRYEVSYLEGLPIVERYVREGLIDYLSFMDHSPGQGQYREPGSFERYVMKNQGVDVVEVREIVRDLMERRSRIEWPILQQLAALAKENGIAVASHDDDSPERVEQFAAYGVSVSEFPLNLPAAERAAAKGMHVCVGAPNVVRGGSHDNNMSAIDAIQAGHARVLCSDYHPSSLLMAVFKLADEGAAALHEAVRMATHYPAEALGVSGERGSIAEGLQADLIAVAVKDSIPIVTGTWVNGVQVYQSGYYHQASPSAGR
ncbi:alpha-D-ribose 1-methylphosphonate 5-triphosphate diphosphatase [Paenibacillus senegalensis]|uniref:alpha-D-ribose 1-methylphosphonate 5-triphosphate diphosphatase n=1 Tax=Paenibacillus senegalensis TaxID=1465766 RepID=UPI0003187E9D|nr:alpha-D-ribose 1-methylphosphonate 5-triphosphate diphosphatase [Paenibacillus senegalensis]